MVIQRMGIFGDGCESLRDNGILNFKFLYKYVWTLSKLSQAGIKSLATKIIDKG